MTVSTTATDCATRLQAWYPVLDFLHRNRLFDRALSYCHPAIGAEAPSTIELELGDFPPDSEQTEDYEQCLKEWLQIDQLFARFVSIYHPTASVQALSAYDIAIPSPVERGSPGEDALRRLQLPSCVQYFDAGYSELQFWVALLQSKTTTELTAIIAQLQAIDTLLARIADPDSAIGSVLRELHKGDRCLYSPSRAPVASITEDQRTKLEALVRPLLTALR